MPGNERDVIRRDLRAARARAVSFVGVAFGAAVVGCGGAASDPPARPDAPAVAPATSAPSTATPTAPAAASPAPAASSELHAADCFDPPPEPPPGGTLRPWPASPCVKERVGGRHGVAPFEVATNNGVVKVAEPPLVVGPWLILNEGDAGCSGETCAHFAYTCKANLAEAVERAPWMGCGWDTAQVIKGGVVVIAPVGEGATIEVRRRDGAKIFSGKLPFQPCAVDVAKHPSAPRLALGSLSFLYELDLDTGRYDKRFASSESSLAGTREVSYSPDGSRICIGRAVFPPRADEYCVAGTVVRAPLPPGMTWTGEVTYKYSRALPSEVLTRDGSTLYRLVRASKPKPGEESGQVFLETRRLGAQPPSLLLALDTEIILDVQEARGRFVVGAGDLMSFEHFAFDLATGKMLARSRCPLP